jgi:predicted enzyme related to lactoylglutathione lyase
MADPLKVLHAADTPVDPDPDFALRLRARVARALAAPEGVAVSSSTHPLSDAPVTLTGTSPAEGDGDVGYFSLWVPDVDRAAAFYGAVLGWTYGDRRPGALAIAGSSPRAIVALDAPGMEYWPERRAGGFVSRGVADIDVAVARVRAAGGRASDPIETPHGRSSDCADDQGTPFSLHEREPGTPRPAINGTESGDVSYFTLRVPDVTRARTFYGEVFGWTFTPGRVAEGWQVGGVAPMTGLWGSHTSSDLVPMYRVDDIAAAVAAVRAADGAATEIEQMPYGLSTQCTDDQGLPFYLGQH